MPSAGHVLRHLLAAVLLVSVGAKVNKDSPPNLQLVKKMSVYSRMIYHVMSTSDTDIKEGIPHFFDDKPNGAEALVLTSTDPDGNDMVTVCYRGSDEFADWITNLDFFLDPFGPRNNRVSGPMKVHGGFNDASFSYGLFDEIEKTIVDLRNDASLDFGNRVYFTGHSLGGAIAQISGAYFALRHPSIDVHMINFGAPQVGNRSFKDWAEAKDNLSMWRFCYEKDVVPRIVPNTGTFVGHLVQLDDDSAHAYYRQTGGGRYQGVPSSWAAAFSVSDHYPANYLKYFEVKALRQPSKYYVKGFVEQAECVKKWWQIWIWC